METENHPYHLDHFENQIRELSRMLKNMSNDNDLEELIEIIKNPLWTRPAEAIFTSGIVASLITQLQGVQVLRGVLLDGSRKVGI